MCHNNGRMYTATVSILLPKYIRMPSGDNLKDAVEGFEHKWGLGTLLPQWNKRIGGKDVPGRPCVPSSIMGDESIPK